MDRLELMKQAKLRVSKINFGDPITNVCSGDNNPRRHSYFVRSGVINHSKVVTCTDKKGEFWDTAIEVIYPGHIDYEESKKIFQPIHRVLYKNLV